VRIGVLGSGGREHALSWALSGSPREPEVFVLPGNGGTVGNLPVDPNDPAAVAGACRDLRLDLLVIGGEEPLARGVADRLLGTNTVPFGPTASAARLETSKSWAKRFLDRHRIPTAEWAMAERDADVGRAARLWGRVVVKADGLAAGKGVVVCDDEHEAVAAWRALRRARPSAEPMLVERALDGWEVSILCITDGRAAALFPAARDHKAIYDGGRGPNTGGMGAYSPAPQCTPELHLQIARQVIAPTLAGLRDEKIDYVGFLYFGLMVTADGPRVLEYNARLGDPEAEVLLPLLREDLLDVVLACSEGRAPARRLDVRSGAAVDVVLASGGYPGPYETGHSIRGLNDVDREVLVFHGATRRQGEEWTTAGGRVLHMVALGDSVAAAAESAYRSAERVHFPGVHMRRDIGRGVV
jgi:phosphoribosylamine--glycine ligase